MHPGPGRVHTRRWDHVRGTDLDAGAHQLGGHHRRTNRGPDPVADPELEPKPNTVAESVANNGVANNVANNVTDTVTVPIADPDWAVPHLHTSELCLHDP